MAGQHVITLNEGNFQQEVLNSSVPVLVDFWATWCGPCMRGLPLVNEFAKWAAESGKPIKVFAINTMEGDKGFDGRKGKVADLWKKKGFGFPTLLDADDTVQEAYGVQGIPFTVIGEFESKGRFLGNNFDEVACIPYPLVDKYWSPPSNAPPWFPKRGELFFDAIAVSPERSDEAIRQISALKSLAEIMGLGDQAPALQGPLNQFVFVRLVFRTFANRSTGCLELRRGDVVKSIYFRRGRIQYIASNQHNELLGPFMVSHGFLSQADIDTAMARVKLTGGRLGDMLIGLNLIKPFQLFQVLERQLRAKLIDSFGWETGQFAFYAEVAPPADIVPLDIDPLTVLTDGVRERVSLAVLEPWFQDKLDRRFYRVRAPVISVASLRFQARESKAQGALLAHDTLRPSYEECYNNRPARLALLHVLFLLLHTDLLTFDEARA